MEGDQGPKKQSIQSVRQAFRIVEGLRDLDGARVSELARHLDLPESTTHVYLSTLRDAGYVSKDDSSKIYNLTLRFLDHGCTIRDRKKLYRVAKPELEDLSTTTGELSNLGCEERGYRVVLYRAEGNDAVFDKAPSGDHCKMHCSAIGKALLAFLPNERVDDILEEHGLPSFTSQTITDKSELKQELETIRERRYAIEDEERHESIRSIAVPLLESESLIGAISLAGPSTKFTDEYIKAELLDPLQNTASVIQLRYSHY